jgi:hypothetical protein
MTNKGMVGKGGRRDESGVHGTSRPKFFVGYLGRSQNKGPADRRSSLEDPASRAAPLLSLLPTPRQLVQGFPRSWLLRHFLSVQSPPYSYL